MSINIEKVFAEHRRAIDSVEAIIPKILEIAAFISQVFDKGGRVFICGNGGSAADAQHFSSELTGRYQKDRQGYPVIALTTDTSALTAIGNDYGFEHIFSRQLQALGRSGDMLIAISTSGNSSNVIKAVEFAGVNGIATVGLLGRDGGMLKSIVDDAIIISVSSTARIQEAHAVVIHLLCEFFEPE